MNMNDSNIKTHHHETLSSSASSSSISTMSATINENFKIILPNGVEKLKKLNYGKAIYDILIEISASEKLQPTHYTLQLFNNDIKLEYRPNQLLSHINPNIIKVVPKQSNEIMNESNTLRRLNLLKNGILSTPNTLKSTKMTNVPNFEMKNLVKINLPHNQKSAIRVKPDIKLNDLFELICSDNFLDKSSYKLTLRNEKFSHENDMNKTLSYYDTYEVYLLQLDDNNNYNKKMENEASKLNYDLSNRNSLEYDAKLIFNKSKSTIDLFNSIDNNLSLKQKEAKEKRKTSILNIFRKKRSKSRCSLNDENFILKQDNKIKENNQVNFDNHELNEKQVKKKQAPLPPQIRGESEVKIDEKFQSNLSQKCEQSNMVLKPSNRNLSTDSDVTDSVSINTIYKKKKAPSPPNIISNVPLSTQSLQSKPLLDENFGSIDENRTELQIDDTLAIDQKEILEENEIRTTITQFSDNQKEYELLQSQEFIENTPNHVEISSKNSSCEDLRKSFANVIQEAENFINISTFAENQYSINEKQPETHNDENFELKIKINPNENENNENLLSTSTNKSNVVEQIENNEKNEKIDLNKYGIEIEEPVREKENIYLNEANIENKDDLKLLFTPKIDDHKSYKVIRSSDVFEKNGTYYSNDGTVRGHIGSVKKLTNSKKICDLFTNTNEIEKENNIHQSNSEMNEKHNGSNQISIPPVSAVISNLEKVNLRECDNFEKNKIEFEDIKFMAKETNLPLKYERRCIENFRAQNNDKNKKSLATIINNEKKVLLPSQSTSIYKKLDQIEKQESAYLKNNTKSYESDNKFNEETINLRETSYRKPNSLPPKVNSSFVISAKNKNTQVQKIADSKNIYDDRKNVLNELRSIVPCIEPIDDKHLNNKILESKETLVKVSDAVNHLRDVNYIERKGDIKLDVESKSVVRPIPPPIAPKSFTLKSSKINSINNTKTPIISLYSTRSDLLDSIRNYNPTILRKTESIHN